MTKAKKNKIYFTEETERAIIRYNNSSNTEERNRIYLEYLDYPLNKLVENVVHTYKLYNTGIEYKDLIKTILEYLIEKMSRIDSTLGRGYSYLTVTARNYGIMLSMQALAKCKNEFDNINCAEVDILSLNKYQIVTNNNDVSEFFVLFDDYIRKNLTSIFIEKKDIEIAEAFLDFFKDVNNIEEFNKKALYIIIREKTKCESRFITTVVNILKANYYQLYELYKNGEIEKIRYYIPISISTYVKKKKINDGRK